MRSQLSLCISQAACEMPSWHPKFWLWAAGQEKWLISTGIILGTTVSWRQCPRRPRPARPLILSGFIWEQSSDHHHSFRMWIPKSSHGHLAAKHITFPQEGKPGILLPQGQLRGGIWETKASQTHWSWHLSSGNGPRMHQILEAVLYFENQITENEHAPIQKVQLKDKWWMITQDHKRDSVLTQGQ